MRTNKEFIRKTNPTPLNSDEIVAYCHNAGLEIIAVDNFQKMVEFSDFKELYYFGMHSGFFTHVLEQCENEKIEAFANLENVFPLKDQYKASIVLARKP